MESGFLEVIENIIIGAVVSGVLMYFVYTQYCVVTMTEDTRRIMHLLQKSLQNQENINDNLIALNKKLHTIADKDI